MGHNIFIWRGELPCDILLFFTKEVPFLKVFFSHHFRILKIYRNFKIVLLLIGQHSNFCWLFFFANTTRKKRTFKQGTSLPCDILLFFTRKVSSICPEYWVEIFFKKHFCFYVQFLFSKKASKIWQNFPLDLTITYLLNFFTYIILKRQMLLQ